MPQMTSTTSVAANAVSANILSGELFEFLPQNSVIAVLATGSAVGLRLTMAIGGEIVANDITLGAQNHIPVNPDDQILEEGGIAGSRLFITMRNTTGGALDGNVTVVITPVG